MYKPHNKWCFVPGCTSTSISTPDKTFIRVPKENVELKKQWFKAARRDLPKSKSEFYCCEDHFNLKEDMENYTRFKLMGGKKIMKRDVVPRFFNCQADCKGTSNHVPPRLLPTKWEWKRLVAEAVGRHVSETEDDDSTDTKKNIRQITRTNSRSTESKPLPTVNTDATGNRIVDGQATTTSAINTQPTNNLTINTLKASTTTINGEPNISIVNSQPTNSSKKKKIIIELLKPNGSVKRSIVCNERPSKIIKINNTVLHKQPKFETSTEAIDSLLAYFIKAYRTTQKLPTHVQDRIKGKISALLKEEEKQLFSKLNVPSTIASLQENPGGGSNPSELCNEENQFKGVKPNISLLTSPLTDDLVLIEETAVSIKTETKEESSDDFLTTSFETFDVFIGKQEQE